MPSGTKPLPEPMLTKVCDAKSLPGDVGWTTWAPPSGFNGFHWGTYVPIGLCALTLVIVMCIFISCCARRKRAMRMRRNRSRLTAIASVPGGGSHANILTPELNGWHFADDIFKSIFLIEDFCIDFHFPCSLFLGVWLKMIQLWLR